MELINREVRNLGRDYLKAGIARAPPGVRRNRPHGPARTDPPDPREQDQGTEKNDQNQEKEHVDQDQGKDQENVNPSREATLESGNGRGKKIRK